MIREKDILACENGEVTFRDKDAKSGRTETRTLSGPEFLWLLLQHVLPKGFRRARNFGFLHPNRKRLIALLQDLVGGDPTRALAVMKPRPKLTRPCCGGDMRIVKTRVVPPFALPPPVPIGEVADPAVR